jgi:hypothetical protein
MYFFAFLIALHSNSSTMLKRSDKNACVNYTNNMRETIYKAEGFILAYNCRGFNQPYSRRVLLSCLRKCPHRHTQKSSLLFPKEPLSSIKFNHYRTMAIDQAWNPSYLGSKIGKPQFEASLGKIKLASPYLQEQARHGARL